VLNQQLLQPLAKSLDVNLARLKCLSLLISAILRHRTVNLTILATTKDGNQCSNESRYRRFQDFFLKFSLCLPSVASFILQRIPKPKGGYVLAMDRTNWEFGRTTINFLAIAIVVGKVSIPIIWVVLPKKSKGGNSNTKQRIALTKKLLAMLPANEIRALTMDREFVGKQWLEWLDQQGVAYVVRVKKNTWVGWRPAIEYASLPGRRSSKHQEVFGLQLYFASKRIKRGGRCSHLLIVSNRFQGKEALALYRMRWGIERLFGHLKKKGFDLEATHMTDPRKLERLFAVVVLAFLFSFGWGCHLRASGEKTSAQSKRKSLFRLGLEDILSHLTGHSPTRCNRKRWRAFLHWLKSSQFDSIFLV